jgi:hypothetical protein
VIAQVRRAGEGGPAAALLRAFERIATDIGSILPPDKGLSCGISQLDVRSHRLRLRGNDRRRRTLPLKAAEPRRLPRWIAEQEFPSGELAASGIRRPRFGTRWRSFGCKVLRAAGVLATASRLATLKSARHSIRRPLNRLQGVLTRIRRAGRAPYATGLNEPARSSLAARRRALPIQPSRRKHDDS